VTLLLATLLASAIHVPAGYQVTTYATGLVHPTAMSFGPDGRLYVSQDTGEIVSVVRGTRRPRPFASKLVVPLGLLWHDGKLYASESGRVQLFTRNGARRTIVRGLPYKDHQQDAIVASGLRNPYGLVFVGRSL